MARNDLTVTDGEDIDNEAIEINKRSPLDFLKNGEIARSIIIILCLAIFLVVGLVIIFWAKEPVLRPLGQYSDTNELNAVMGYLKQNEFEYRFYDLKDGKQNVISVNVEDYDRIVEGLTVNGVVDTSPKDGSEILLGDSSFGVSARKEEERLKYAREQQIANMLKNNRKIVDAKVLLAIPRRNVFSRNEQKPSASVNLKIGGSGALSSSEVDAIVDSVASSVHGLEPSRVTVIDQNGRLLNSGSMDAATQSMRRATELQSQKERDYTRKIEEILNPILGYGNYTPMVAVSLGNVSEDITSKTYTDNPTIRSEQVSEEYSNKRKAAGVPGATSNQPPANASIPERITESEANSQNNGGTGSERRNAVRNYELDTTITHTKKHSGNVERLSVSVAINYRDVVGEDGKVTKVPRDEKEISTIHDLLAKGLGIDETRGDTLAVHSVQFFKEDFGEIEPVPFYETEVFEKILRVVLSAIIIIAILLLIVKPMVMSLINKKSPKDNHEEYDVDGEVALEGYDELNLLATHGDDSDSLYNIKNGQVVLPNLHKDEDLLRAVRSLVANEPDLAAQVVKDWVSGLGDEK